MPAEAPPIMTRRPETSFTGNGPVSGACTPAGCGGGEHMNEVEAVREWYSRECYEIHERATWASCYVRSRQFYGVF
jgi:hypothetical protein